MKRILILIDGSDNDRSSLGTAAAAVKATNSAFQVKHGLAYSPESSPREKLNILLVRLEQDAYEAIMGMSEKQAKAYLVKLNVLGKSVFHLTAGNAVRSWSAVRKNSGEMFFNFEKK